MESQTTNHLADSITREILISVIVPLYNTPFPFLEKCIESLRIQKEEKAEYIIVDDGSNKETVQVCRSLIEGDDRFKLVQLEGNQGVSVARNKGIDESSGAYIIFVDADDSVPEGFLEKLAKFLIESNDDIIFYRFANNEEDCKATCDMKRHDAPSNIRIAESVMTYNEKKLGYPGGTFGAVWTKAFRRRFLDEAEVRFLPGIIKTQDRLFMVQILAHNPTTSLFDCFGYCYNFNDSSFCHKFNPKMAELSERTARAFEHVIESNYEGQDKTVLQKALFYLRFNFTMDTDMSYFFHAGNPQFGHQRREYKRYCSERKDIIEACETRNIPRRRNRIILRLLKMHMPSLAYAIALLHAKRQAKKDAALIEHCEHPAAS